MAYLIVTYPLWYKVYKETHNGSHISQQITSHMILLILCDQQCIKSHKMALSNLKNDKSYGMPELKNPLYSKVYGGTWTAFWIEYAIKPIKARRFVNSF